MPQHKALRGDKTVAKRTRGKGPGRHAVGVPQLTEDELLAAYPFLALNDHLAPVIVEFDEPAEEVTVEAANLEGLSTPEAIADAWSDEADRLEQARLARLNRAEERRLARERAAAESAARARLDAEAEAERVRTARESLVVSEAEEEGAADVEVEVEEVAEAESEADVEAEEAEVVEQTEAAGAQYESDPIELPSFFNVTPGEVEPLPEVPTPVELPTIQVIGIENAAAADEPELAEPVDEKETVPAVGADVVQGLVTEPETPALPEFLSDVALDTAAVEAEAEPELDESTAEASKPAFSFDDILIGSIDDPVSEPEAAAEIEPVIEPEIVEAEPDDAVVAELVLDKGAELTPAQQQEVVHIHHHHYENAQPQAPQIIIAPPPIVATEWPADMPVPTYPATQPTPQRRPQTPRAEYVDYRDDAETERPVVEEHYDHYAAEEEPKRRPRRDDSPVKFQEQEKEPLFTFFGRPLGGGKKNSEPRGGGQRAIEGPRRPSNAARALAEGVTGADDVDPQTWFDDIVAEAIDRDASDLHIRVEEDGTGYGDILSARVRVDGRMRHLQTVAGLDARVIINRFKTNASLSSDGSYVPEESTYEIPVGDEVRKARVALFRTSTGGDALVLRLPPAGALRTLDDLNFAPKNKALVHTLLHAANRMVMVAGPMGSGKTTTAHAALMSVTTPERSVWSLEDPVERDLPNVTQLELDERNGAGFDTVLPVLVRSDYDTLFLGEIRDPATAGAGVRQAKAGRQVITTIHANDNVGALYRLIELSGESPREVLDSVAGVISQRLVGRLNPDWDGQDPETRYRGRVPIHEVLRITPELIEAVMRDEPITKVQAIAAAASDSTFISDAQRLVNERVTDVDEVNRVLGLTSAV